jgi:hypothetical protein
MQFLCNDKAAFAKAVEENYKEKLATMAVMPNAN